MSALPQIEPAEAAGEAAVLLTAMRHSADDQRIELGPGPEGRKELKALTAAP